MVDTVDTRANRRQVTLWGFRIGLVAVVCGLIMVMIASANIFQPHDVEPPRPYTVDARIAAALSGPPTGRQWFVAPDGSPDNRGTVRQPLDLATALSAAGPARPGDTIWLRGGTYHGPFVSRLAGTATLPIFVRQVVGERATIDGGAAPAEPVLAIHGQHTVFVGFEVTNSNPNRYGSRGVGIDIFGPSTKVINVVVHDAGGGFGFWSPAVDSELYGNIIYNIGWEADDRGHGHSIYVQNEVGTKHIIDNVMFNGYSFGIHGYSEQGRIDNLYIEGNVSFNHGLLSRVSGAKANVLVGGRRVASHPVVLSNYTYYPLGSAGRNADIGYLAGCDGAIIRDNYLAGGVPLVLTRCDDAQVTRNMMFGPVDGSISDRYGDNLYAVSRPGTAAVFIRPNVYQPGRAHLVVYNWSRAPEVRVDLDAARIVLGGRFEIRDVQDYFGAPLVEGVYTGQPIVLPMSELRVAAPVGGPVLAHTAPDFAVFLVASDAGLHTRN